MFELVHRAAPESARARALLALAFGGVAALCLVLVFSLNGLVVPMTVAVGGLSAALALVLGYGLTTQAAAAPEEANPAFSPERVEAADETDPIGTLQQRYAEGELTDEEFEDRMDRLLDSGAATAKPTDESENEPAFER